MRLYVTGKGLDVIIDEVKKRTGLSPFLRGKHSSLDPFGTVSVEGDDDGSRPAVYMPTFQAEKYVHEVPAEADPTALSGMLGGKKLKKRKAMSPMRDGSESEESLWPFDDDFMASIKSSSSRSHSSSPPLLSPEDSQNLHGTYHNHHHSHRLNYSYPTSADLSRAIQPNEQSIQPKKRRLAPAPAPLVSVHPEFGTDASRLYYDHHPQTR